MLYSKTCEYAIRAAAYMASKEKSQYTSTVEVNRATGIPGPYLAKVFGVLVKKSLLKAKQGPGGGVAFTREPKEISLLDVIAAVETTDLVIKQCVMGLSECNAKHACPMHHEWVELKSRMVSKLAGVSICDVSEKLLSSSFRELKRDRLASHVCRTRRET